ncbi:MAG: hypothetical protein KO464_01255 [Candidatus Methanofastidiosum sp.]|nr:hypothetical protein [Methanofastidiosum sp.]
MKEVKIADIQEEIEKEIEVGKKMVDEGKKLLEEGKYKLNESKSRIRELGDEAGIKLKDFEEKHHDELDYVVKESEKALQETEIFIRKNPVLSVFAAFGFGYIMGKLLRK